jgi:uncharacterized protein YjbI with pentapeptide repeats
MKRQATNVIDSRGNAETDARFLKNIICGTLIAAGIGAAAVYSSAASANGYLNCLSEYEDGIRPTTEDLDWMTQWVSQADARGNRDPEPHWGVFYCLKGADLSDMDLSNGSFAQFAQQARLDGADLTGTNLAGADLRNAVLDDINIDWKTDFSGANLAGAYVRGRFNTIDYLVNVENTNFTGANLRDVRFSSAAQGAVFAHADLTQTQFRKAKLQEVDFSGAAMRGANFQQSDLSGADLRYADLDYARFEEVDLTGADLTGAYFGKAEFTDVVWNDTTCPDGSSSNADDGDNYSCANNTTVEWRQTRSDEIWIAQNINSFLDALRNPDANKEALGRMGSFAKEGKGIDEQIAFVAERGGLTNMRVESVAWGRDPANYSPGAYAQFVVVCDYKTSDEECRQRITYKLRIWDNYEKYGDNYLIHKYETKI